MIMKEKLFSSLVLMISMLVSTGAAYATPILGFNGVYDVSTWTTSFTTTTDVDAVLGTGGSVDTSGAPTTISLIEPDAENNIGYEYGVLFTNVAAADGIFAFDWDYTGDDDCCSAVYAYIGDLTTPSTEGVGPFLAHGDDIDTSGSFTASILAGQVFGWGNFTNDDCCGANVLTITNFSAPGTSVSEPSALALLGLGLLGLVLNRRRQLKTHA